MVRQQRTREAIAALEQAARLAPENQRYSYVYAVALHSTGRPRQATSALEQTLTQHPYNRDILSALTMVHRDLSDVEAAIGYAERLLAVVPHSPSTQQLLQQLRSRR